MPKFRDNESHALGGVILNPPKAGTPVNAEKAKATLTYTDVVIDGETITIGNDVYEFAADEAQSVEAGNIAVDIQEYTTQSTQTLTVDTQVTATDTMTVGTTEYTFVANGTEELGEDDIELGADLAGTQANIVAKLNARADVTCSDFNESDVATITAVVGGTAGDAIATTETFTAETNIFGGNALASGADCTAANAILAVVAASADGTEFVVVTDGAGDTLVVTAVYAGAYPEHIVTETTCANGTFDAEHLDGGVDGTLADRGDLYLDASYLYIATADNGVTGTNWKKITLAAL